MHRIAFAQALKENDPSIDGKICGKTASDRTPYTKEHGSAYENACNQGGQGSTQSDTTNGGFGKFTEIVVNGGTNWPKAPQNSGGDKDNSLLVAKDVTSLPKDDKVLVVGHLAGYISTVTFYQHFYMLM